jgi:hypothetical protein
MIVVPAKRDWAQAGTQSFNNSAELCLPWVPDIPLMRNSGMTVAARFRDTRSNT